MATENHICWTCQATYDGPRATGKCPRCENGGKEALTSNEKSPRPSDERNGCFLDKMGCCKVCDGEIPDGHTDYCDIWKMENDRNRLQADLDWIARMGVSIKTLPDGQRAVVDELRASDETSALEVCVSVNVDGTGNWFPAERLERPDVLVRLDDGTIGVWPIERVRTVGSAEETEPPLCNCGEFCNQSIGSPFTGTCRRTANGLPVKASPPPRGGSVYRVCCARCQLEVNLTASDGRVNLYQEASAGWYFSTETGWLCPADAPKESVENGKAE